MNALPVLMTDTTATNCGEQRDPAERRPDGMPRGTPFVKGKGGNPAGRPKSIVAIERELREAEGPYVLEVMETLRGVALSGDVPAIKLWLERLIGPVKPVAEELGKLTEAELEQRIAEALGVDGDELRSLRSGPQ